MTVFSLKEVEERSSRQRQRTQITLRRMSRVEMMRDRLLRDEYGENIGND